MQMLDIQYCFKLYPNIVCLHNGMLYQLEHCPGKRTKVFRKLTYNEKRNAYYINGGLVTRKRLEKLKIKIHGKKNRQRS
jgi:DNA repair ATPase RecN